MARELRFMGAGRTSPDERRLAPEDRRGPVIVIRVISVDLKGHPVHELPLTRKQALEAVQQLVNALSLDLFR